MNDLLDKITLTGGAIVAALVTLAAYLPKLLNGMKGDKIESNLLTRVENAEAMIVELSNTVHDHAIDLTLAQMMILKLYHAMRDKGNEIPPDVEDYVAEMMRRHTKKKAQP